jgi:cytochrome c oxidase subunit IV
VGLGEAWEKMRAVPVDWSQLVINGIVVLWALRGEYFHFLLILFLGFLLAFTSSEVVLFSYLSWDGCCCPCSILLLPLLFLVFLLVLLTTVSSTVGTYTFVRSILRGGDSRFDGIRENRTRFLMAFLMQALWVWFCTLPIVAINTLPAEPFRGMWCKKFGAEMLPIPTCYIRLAWFALGIWSIVRGSAIELLADWQLSKWMWDRKMKRHDEVFCKRGLWLKW